MSCFKDRKDITINISMEEANVLVCGVASLIAMLQLGGEARVNAHLPDMKDIIKFGGELGHTLSKEFPDWHKMFSKEINKKADLRLEEMSKMTEDEVLEELSSFFKS